MASVIVTELKNNIDILCKYGCGKLARFRTKHNFMCDTNSSKCPAMRAHIGAAVISSAAFITHSNEEDHLCDYGCDKLAKYKTASNKFCCSEYVTQCSVHKKKRLANMIPWNKGLTKETDKRVAKYADALQDGIKSGRIKFVGTPHTEESKERLSKAAMKQKRGGGFPHVKHYYIYSPHTGKKHHVRGGYELNYAKYLNENKISWERGHAIQYKHNKKDYIHNYMPDFYLVDTDEYIETKGYYSPYDKKKMKAVKKCNPGVKITLLFYDDLKKLGVL